MVSDFDKKQKKGVLLRKFYFIAGSFLFLGLSAVLIFADVKIYKEKQKLNAQLDVYKKQVQEIEDRNKALKEGIAEAGNSAYVEKIAREELDLQKQGEKVVTFIMPQQKQQEQKTSQQNFLNFNAWTSWLSGWWQGIKSKF